MSQPSIDIGNLGKWSVSSKKFGFGINHLRNNNDETFWQSEGPQPHWIDVAFPRKVYISAVHICLSHTNDDSYTPERISVHLGTNNHDLVEVRMLRLEKPEGWSIHPVRPVARLRPDGSAEDGSEAEGPPMPAYYIRIQIVANHLNGKDTHVRGIKMYGIPSSAMMAQRVNPHVAAPVPHPPITTPTAEPPRPLADSAYDPLVDPVVQKGLKIMEEGFDCLSGFTSLEYKMHETIR